MKGLSRFLFTNNIDLKEILDIYILKFWSRNIVFLVKTINS